MEIGQPIAASEPPSISVKLTTPDNQATPQVEKQALPAPFQPEDSQLPPLNQNMAVIDAPVIENRESGSVGEKDGNANESATEEKSGLKPMSLELLPVVASGEKNEFDPMSHEEELAHAEKDVEGEGGEKGEKAPEVWVEEGVHTPLQAPPPFEQKSEREMDGETESENEKEDEIVDPHTPGPAPENENVQGENAPAPADANTFLAEQTENDKDKEVVPVAVIVGEGEAEREGEGEGEGEGKGMGGEAEVVEGGARGEEGAEMEQDSDTEGEEEEGGGVEAWRHRDWAEACSICFDNRCDFSLPGCQDQFCRPCIQRYFGEKIRASWGLTALRLTCPVCYDPLPVEIVCRYLDSETTKLCLERTNQQRNLSRHCPECQAENNVTQAPPVTYAARTESRGEYEKKLKEFLKDDHAAQACIRLYNVYQSSNMDPKVFFNRFLALCHHTTTTAATESQATTATATTTNNATIDSTSTTNVNGEKTEGKVDENDGGKGAVVVGEGVKGKREDIVWENFDSYLQGRAVPGDMANIMRLMVSQCVSLDKRLALQFRFVMTFPESTCSQCFCRFCFFCGEATWHEGFTCEDYMREQVQTYRNKRTYAETSSSGEEEEDRSWKRHRSSDNEKTETRKDSACVMENEHGNENEHETENETENDTENGNKNPVVVGEVGGDEDVSDREVERKVSAAIEKLKIGEGKEKEKGGFSVSDGEGVVMGGGEGRKRRRRSSAPSPEDIDCLEWKLANSKRCPNCRIFIQRDDGCNKMDCPFCGNEFCWRCMRGWTSECGFYTCGMDQNAPVAGDDDHQTKRPKVPQAELGVPDVTSATFGRFRVR